MRLPVRLAVAVLAALVVAVALSVVRRSGTWAAAAADGDDASLAPEESAAYAVAKQLERRTEERMRREAATRPPPPPTTAAAAAVDDDVVVGVDADPVFAPGGVDAAGNTRPPTSLTVLRWDVKREVSGVLRSQCKERPTQACARCGAPCSSELAPRNLAPAAVVSAVLGCNARGPIVSVLLAVGRWRYNTTAVPGGMSLVPDPVIAVRLEGAVTVSTSTAPAAAAGETVVLRELDVVGTGEHDTSRYDYEMNAHGHAVVEIPLPRGVFNTQFAAAAPGSLVVTARFKATCRQTLTMYVPVGGGSTASPLAAPIEVELTSEFPAVHVDLPIGFDPSTFARLVGGLPTSPALVPRMVGCYGPIFAFGTNPPMFFDYLIEFIEYHRRIGLAHMVFYFWAPGYSRELETFKKLYRADGNLLTLVHYDTFTPNADAYNFGQRMVINDCLARFKSDPQFVFVADMDEWLWPARAPTIPGALRELINTHVTSGSGATNYIFRVMEDHVHLADVCEPVSSDETVAQASDRLARDRPLLLSRSPYFYTNCHLGGARRKTVSLARLTTTAEEHEPIGGEQSAMSMGEASGIIKVHARDLPHLQPPPSCARFEAEFFEKTPELSKAVDCNVLKTLKVPYFAEGYIDLAEKAVVLQRSRFHALLEEGL